MAFRGRQRKKSKVAGNTRMDAALDAMSHFGFEKRGVRKTVQELLDVGLIFHQVYEGTQGWPFMEEASYKLLIETILAKQQTSEGKNKDNERRDDGVAERSSAATCTTGITEVGSSGLVAHETLLNASDGLDSASQTFDRDHIETNVKDLSEEVDRGHGPSITVESKIIADNVKISNDGRVMGEVERHSLGKTPMIESSKALGGRRHYFGWIDDDVDDSVELTYFPLPPLSCEPPQKRRRKSRWDEKPDADNCFSSATAPSSPFS
ncbi:hypothetical protein RJT34_11388 [Clitoria ternatea]|uniref:WIYLD domain-containing protein n=1 Tax=Clitoria ternatea TaxID=43366 RepID=A0AAN9PKH2_CLITE